MRCFGDGSSLGAVGTRPRAFSLCLGIGVCDLSAGGWRELKKEAGDVPAGGGTEEGLLGEKFLGMFTNVFFLFQCGSVCV